MTDIHIKPIVSDPVLETLLKNEGLPVQDIHQSNIQLFGGFANAEFMAAIGIERHQTTGLFRSLVVSPEARSAGYGVAMVKYAEKWAQDQGISALYLLTTTASRFFDKLGYTYIDRSEAPTAITETTQFASLCPQSAPLMYKRIEPC